MSFVYRLRPDVTFHNGDPLTAADVKFSMDRGALGTAEYNPDFFRPLRPVSGPRRERRGDSK